MIAGRLRRDSSPEIDLVSFGGPHPGASRCGVMMLVEQTPVGLGCRSEAGWSGC